MTLISSRNNPKIKQARALRQRKARQESRLFLVEGIRHVGEAVQAGAHLEAIYYAPDQLTSEFAQELIRTQARAGVLCYAATADVFAALADRENPQGILAVVHQPKRRLNDLTVQNFPWGVALVSPQDPGNLGAILRTIDAVGASGMLLLDDGVDAYHPAAVRASMGTLFWYPVVSATFSAFAAWVQRNAYHVYGTSTHASLDYRQASPYLSPRILLLGSEREGLSASQAAICERVVSMPMLGRATSLNLAVAAGVMLYAMMPI